MFPLFSWPFLFVLDLALVLTVIPKVKSSNLKEQEAPVAAVIETAPEKGGDDDGEVRSNNIFVSVATYFQHTNPAYRENQQQTLFKFLLSHDHVFYSSNIQIR